MAVEILGAGALVREHILSQEVAVSSLLSFGYSTKLAAIAIGTDVLNDRPAAGPAVRPYLGGLHDLTGKVGIQELLRICRDADEAAMAVLELQGTPTIFMDDPRISLEAREHILDGLLPEDDIDGMTVLGRKLSFPATGLSVVDYANWGVSLANSRRSNGESFGGLSTVDPDRIAIVGCTSVLVGEPAIAKLKDRWGIVPGIRIQRNNSAELIPALHRNADVIISSVGIAGLLKAEHLIRQEGDSQSPMVVIDAGVAQHRRRENGNVWGDVDPGFYFCDAEQEYLVSPAPVIYGNKRMKFGAGAGALTVAHLVNNAILATERQAGLADEPSPAKVA